MEYKKNEFGKTRQLLAYFFMNELYGFRPVVCTLESVNTTGGTTVNEINLFQTKSHMYLFTYA
jgi:hypothetical protein